jgi:hypothetical protein
MNENRRRQERGIKKERKRKNRNEEKAGNI